MTYGLGSIPEPNFNLSTMQVAPRTKKMHRGSERERSGRWTREIQKDTVSEGVF